jgi:predicted transcriptional regulator
MVKVTFTLDDLTVETLRHTAARLKKPQSVVVREAIQEFATRADRLSENERDRLLKEFDRLVSRIPKRRPSDVNKEIAAIRAARKSGGRRTRVE